MLQYLTYSKVSSSNASGASMHGSCYGLHMTTEYLRCIGERGTRGDRIGLGRKMNSGRRNREEDRMSFIQVEFIAAGTCTNAVLADLPSFASADCRPAETERPPQSPGRALTRRGRSRTSRRYPPNSSRAPTQGLPCPSHHRRGTAETAACRRAPRSPGTKRW